MVFVELTQAEEKKIKTQTRKKASKLCQEQAKAYMNCINNTFFAWKCINLFKEYHDCFKEHASEEALFKARIDFLKEKKEKV